MSAGARAVCPVLVGRELELSRLEGSLLRAVQGEGSVVVIGGEAGLGKTRLTVELTHRALTLGSQVMGGACSEADVSLPYLPFLEAIGNHLGRLDLEELRAALGPAAQELAQLFPQLGAGPGPGGDSVQSKLRLFEAILMLLRVAAGRSGLLLVLEDLHWADPATRELLDYMTRRLRSTNVLIVGTYRTEELHRKHALLPTLQGWRRSGQVEVVEVQALSERAIGDMLCAIFDQDEVSVEFRHFVLTRTEGNPFVVEEMLKEAIDRGDIFQTEHGWDRKEVGDLRLPPSVRDGILLRVERLGEGDALVLSAAAVAGRSFDVGLLVAATRLDEEAVLASLQRCVLHQLLVEDSESSASYRYRHSLTREAVYEDMVTPRRQQLHGRVVDVLIARDRPATEIAHHLLLAGRNQEAVAMCMRAAREAIKAVAYRDGAELLERALPHAQGDRERGRIMCLAAEARWNNIQAGVARKLLEEGIALLEAAGEAAEAASNRILLGRCLWELQRTDLAQREFQGAFQALEPLGPSEALATALIRLAGISTFNGRPAESLDLCTRAEAIASAAGADRPLAWAWIFRANAELSLGNYTAGMEYLERGFRRSVEGGYWFQAGNAIYNACWQSVHLGCGNTARQWLERAAADVPPGSMESWIGYIQALVWLHSGDLHSALSAVREAQQITEEAGQEKTAWRCRVAQAQILAELDRAAEAATLLPPLGSRVDTQDGVYDTGARVRSALAAGDRGAALEAARTVDPLACELGSPADVIAQAALGLDPAFLLEFVDRLPVAGENLESPRYLSARGGAALAGGDVPLAIELLGRAVGRFRAEGLTLDCWHASLLLARAEAAGGRRASASERLTAVVVEAGAAGAALVGRLSRELAIELGLALNVPETAPGLPASDDEVVPALPRLTGERLVSVLFADIRGYTALSGTTPPVDLVDGISALHRWASQEVRANHGVVDKFAGDAVMATFNTAGTSVDHARHALECARALIARAALAGFEVGAGIATGPAIVGRLSEAGNLSVIGQATNLAARLQATSGPGEVTVSEETRRRLGAAAGGAPGQRVELALKGFDDPVVAYRFQAHDNR